MAELLESSAARLRNSAFHSADEQTQLSAEKQQVQPTRCVSNPINENTALMSHHFRRTFSCRKSLRGPFVGHFKQILGNQMGVVHVFSLVVAPTPTAVPVGTPLHYDPGTPHFLLYCLGPPQTTMPSGGSTALLAHLDFPTLPLLYCTARGPPPPTLLHCPWHEVIVDVRGHTFG